MLLVCRALSAKGGAPDRGVILLPAAGVMAFALLAGSLLLVSLGSPQEKLDSFFSRGGGAVRSAIHTLRYEGEMLPGLPEGDLSRPGDRLSMKDALEVTFEAPYPMHLRGYVGQRFTGSGWEALERNTVAGYNSLFYRLHQNGFYPQTQLGSLAEALGYYDEGRANRMTVKNISACRSAVYAPYGLADVKTDGLLDADRTTEASLCSPGWSGQERSAVPWGNLSPWPSPSTGPGPGCGGCWFGPTWACPKRTARRRRPACPACWASTPGAGKF